MKYVASILLLLAVALSPLPGAPAGIGLLPEDKTPVVVVEDERNPFGKRSAKVATKVQEEVESEESKIRAVVGRLSLGGMTHGYGVVKVLVGSFTVAEGGMLPDVIPDQTEKVKVLSVSADKVELGFVDKDGSAETRKITLGFDLKPTVRFNLGIPPAAEPKESGGAALNGVTKKNEAGTSR